MAVEIPSIEKSDLEMIGQLGRALWADPERSQRASMDSLTVASATQQDSIKAVIKVSQAMLGRAQSDGPAVNQSALDDPFYRLLPEERFILSALHVGNWSYARIALVLGLNHDQVGRLAWSARLHLSSLPPPKNSSKKLRKRLITPQHPRGSKKNGQNCPEYHEQLPWTQKFLDEETPHRQQLFLSQHLMACDTCRKSLMSCRDLFYHVESMIPRLDKRAELPSLVDQLDRLWRRARQLSLPIWKTPLRGLWVFVRRPSVALALMFLIGMILHGVWPW